MENFMAVQNFHIVEEQDRFKFFGRRANEIGTASNSAEKKGSPSEGVAEGGGWGEEFRHARAVAKRFRRLALSQTSKQNNFQFLLKEKGSREKLKN